MRTFVYAVVALVAGVAFLLWHRSNNRDPSEEIFQPATRRIEPAPLCPWREPESDLRALFPEFTDYRKDIAILSGRRLELQERLGRAPAADENALYLYHVLRGEQRMGTILTRRVKGEDGAIEIVLAVGQDQRVLGLRLQQLREPEVIARALEDPAWLGAFAGKRVSDSWVLGKDIPAVPTEAQASAKSIIEGVRSLLVLLAVAETQPMAAPHHARAETFRMKLGWFYCKLS